MVISHGAHYTACKNCGSLHPIKAGNMTLHVNPAVLQTNFMHGPQGDAVPMDDLFMTDVEVQIIEPEQPIMHFHNPINIQQVPGGYNPVIAPIIPIPDIVIARIFASYQQMYVRIENFSDPTYSDYEIAMQKINLHNDTRFQLKELARNVQKVFQNIETAVPGSQMRQECEAVFHGFLSELFFELEDFNGGGVRAAAEKLVLAEGRVKILLGLLDHGDDNNLDFYGGL